MSNAIKISKTPALNIHTEEKTVHPFHYSSEFFSDEKPLNSWVNRIEYFRDAATSLHSYGPKYQNNAFVYEKEIEDFQISYNGEDSKTVLTELSHILEGGIRSQSSQAVFNMVPQPLMDTQAAAAAMQLYNVNAIMDTYGGKALLYEQQVARLLGKWVGWSKANGLACNGGKITLLYAIKSAIKRMAPDSDKLGIPKDIVILTSEGAHYSIEHCCEFLGLGSNQCIRIPVDASKGVSHFNLQDTIRKQHNAGKRIAAILCCGGTTLDFVCDDTQSIVDSVHSVKKDLNLEYTPYLHFDSVIGWLWFSFLSDSTRLETLPLPIASKIQKALDKFKGLQRFDSFGVDFHKNGLCPYSSSFFIAKDLPITRHNNGASKSYGEVRAFDFTFENSRPASGIASAWVSLKRLGIKGLQEYLISLLEASDQFKFILSSHANVTLLNNDSLGWEVIFSLEPCPSVSQLYSKDVISEDFYRYVTELTQNGQPIPSISIIKQFGELYKSEGETGYILYPMHPNLKIKDIEKIVGSILNSYEKHQQLLSNKSRQISDKPVALPIR